MKTLVTRPHMLLGACVGIQVGWSVPLQDGTPWVVYWGSTKDADSLRKLVADLREKDTDGFIYDEDPRTPEEIEQAGIDQTDAAIYALSLMEKFDDRRRA